MSELPGAELYAQRVSKAAELPPDSRSSDCAAFLAAHGLLEEAAAVLLPPAPAEGGPELEEAGAPAGPAEAEDTEKQLALLKWLTAGSGVGLPRPQPLPLPHPRLDFPAGTAAALAALVQLDAGGSSGGGGSGGAGSSSGGGAAGGGLAAKLLPKPQLESLLHPDGPPPSLQQLAALLLLARIWLRQGDGGQARQALAAAARCFGPESRSLRQEEAEAELAAQAKVFEQVMEGQPEVPAVPVADGPAAEQLDAQLAALRAAPCSGGGGWQVPSAGDLHAVLLHLRLEACMPEPGSLQQGEEDDNGWPQPRGEPALLAAQRWRDARALVALRPGDARSHEWAAAAGQAAVGFAAHPVFLGMQKREEHFRGPVQHLERALQLAHEAGSDALAAKLGYQLGQLCVTSALGLLQTNFSPVCTALPPSYVTVTPAQASVYLEVADAALNACKAWAPFAWLAELRAARKEAAAVRPHLQKQLQHRPEAWSYLNDEVNCRRGRCGRRMAAC